MDSYLYFMVGTVVGFWFSVVLFGTLIYSASKNMPKFSQAKHNVRDLYPPKDNN